MNIENHNNLAVAKNSLLIKSKIYSAGYRVFLNPVFSVVIATYNRSSLLRRALSALANQNLSISEYEIIVINDGSTDGTESLIASHTYESESVPITLVTLTKNCGPATARNIGILQARGKYIAFTDDDCIVPENWLKAFREELESDPELAGVGGNKKPIAMPDSGQPTIFDVYFYLRRLPVMRERFKSAAYDAKNNCGDTANVCYLADALKKVGGFDPSFRYLEDWELKIRMHKAGFFLLYRPDSCVMHMTRTGFRDFIQHFFMFGKEAKQISTFHTEVCFFNPTLGGALKRTAYELSFLSKEAKREYGNERYSQYLLTAPAFIANSLLFLGANQTTR